MTTLDEREHRIENAERDAYVIRGRELSAIRDDQSWRARYNCTTFEEYCEQRWELEKVYAYRLMNAAAFAEKVANWQLPAPTRESHIRPLLSRLETDEDRIAVWRDLLGTTNSGKIRAQDVDNAITRFLALRNKDYLTLTEWHELSKADRAAALSRIGKRTRTSNGRTGRGIRLPAACTVARTATPVI
jgi:hypothetical protein